jgi:chromosome partitioning protein
LANTKIISIVNQKGGVGKTTTVINIGAALATKGKRVLLVDLDPQGNLSSGTNIDPSQTVENNVYLALVGEKRLIDCALETAVPNLWVVPSNSNLAGAEVELVDVQRREYRLRESLSQEVLEFDYVLIDCPPSLGLLTLNALCASTNYLIPLQSEFFAMQGLANILRTVELVKKVFNPSLAEEGILVTMYDSRSNLSKQVYTELKQFAKDRLFQTVIPRRVRLAESTSHGTPGVIYDPLCLGSRSYQEVADELLARASGEKFIKKGAEFVPPDPVDSIVRGVITPVEDPSLGLNSPSINKEAAL